MSAAMTGLRLEGSTVPLRALVVLTSLELRLERIRPTQFVLPENASALDTDHRIVGQIIQIHWLQEPNPTDAIYIYIYIL